MTAKVNEKKEWYSKFTRKNEIAKEKSRRKEFNKERDAFFDKQRRGENNSSFVKGSNFATQKKIQPEASILEQKNQFDFSALPKDAVQILEDFDSIVQGVRPLNSRQIQELPKDIRALSHQLTDERGERRGGYMNKTQELSAYVRYFLWWNLVRLTRVFANIPVEDFCLEDDGVLLDIGSGPLSVVIALWLARPELRNRKITCYCLDISQSSMALGEDLFLSVASKALPSNSSAPGWSIVRVKGEIGTQIRKKANFVSCANMFNELCQKNKGTQEELVQKQLDFLLGYADKNAAFFVAEPGMPESGYFISSLRSGFLNNGCMLCAPCPHSKNCPMDGKNARYGGSKKWCNFSFTTQDAPSKLKKRSEQAGIPKERAVLNFLFAKKTSGQIAAVVEQKAKQTAQGSPLYVRIVSDEIRLSDGNRAVYACSGLGLTVCVNISKKELRSGDMLTLALTKDENALEHDQKTGGLKIYI